MLSEIEQIASLSPREVTVLSYLADGHSNRDICEFLSLNSRTVSTYKLRLFRKLNIKSLVELAEVARRNHILGRAVATQHAGDATWPIADDGYKTLRKVLDAVPSGLCVRDLAGKLLFANKFLLSRLEKEEGEVLGTELTELEGLESKQAALLQAQYLDAAQRGSPFETEIMLRFRREHRPVLYWGSPVADGAGVTKAFICGVQNVQGQELLFLQLRAEKERAEAASAAKSLLLIEHAEGMVNQIEQLTQALAPLMEGAGAQLSTGAAWRMLSRPLTHWHHRWEVFRRSSRLTGLPSSLYASRAMCQCFSGSSLKSSRRATPRGKRESISTTAKWMWTKSGSTLTVSDRFFQVFSLSAWSMRKSLSLMSHCARRRAAVRSSSSK